ncbi:hypothetical protein C7C46_33070 [Streptomyces tateyamensis]|uniref:Knr4/Smi1-like domain-containing protein n=1 Tax=Streptomyces tateyamensis TaxID=565073 RepID=A0A2V4NSR4_9ACTN|nr:SMI1/KNR4 family protein [Streptomyces tateyamensis]PYC63908.1 hypothetical protein C7C46_33070 [Streptomyces tateyamensis]
MDFADFVALIDETRRLHPWWLAGFEPMRATEEDLDHVRRELSISLPADYLRFMSEIGGGAFGFMDIFPARSDSPQRDDVVAVNSQSWCPANFYAFAPVGTGDLWGFSRDGDEAIDGVFFLDHEDGSLTSEGMGFLDFLAANALRPR